MRRRRTGRWVMGVLVFILGMFGILTSVPYYQSDWMDSPETRDPYFGVDLYLDPTQTDRPVIIAVHGFSASTAEWREFKDYAESTCNVYVHPVLLGGHGQDYRAFARASWEEWRAPVEDAIRYYVSHGFERIYLVGSSAGGPLILSMLDLEAFRSESIRGVAFVDPFIVAKPKMFGYIDGFWGSLIKMWPVHLGQDTRKFRYWYGNYPMSALKELKELVGLTRSRLDKGVVLPNQMPMLILQASDDPVSDVKGASVLLQRVRPFGELQVVDSGYHVFTRKVGQEMGGWTEGDDDTQRWAFDELIRFFNLEQVAL